MSMDPRLAERRVEVAEDRAKRNVGRLLRFFLFIAVIGGLVWFALSPWMSVAEVRTSGVESSATDEVLTAHDFVPGTPMILLRTGPLIDQLRTDPWVRDVEVRLGWPSHVMVRVDERVPRAWVETASGWARRSEDGHRLPGPTGPDETLGRVVLPHLLDEDAVESELVTGSIEFLMALTPEHAVGATVRWEEGELWATVDGFEVRLGRAVEMREKAVSLLALLDRGLAEDTVIILVAPTHPSTVDPVTEDDDDGGEDSGEDDEGESDGESDENDSEDGSGDD